MSCDKCRGRTSPVSGSRCKFCGVVPAQLEHHCHAAGCGKSVHPKMLMCAKHWKLVPFAVQCRIYATYVPGQEMRKDASEKFLEAMGIAVEIVEQEEKRKGGASGSG